LIQIQNFIEENKHLGYTTREEFIRDAIRFKLTWLSQEREFVEIPREQYDLLNEAIKEMNTSYRNAEDFINIQIKQALEKYEEWKQATKNRRSRKE
jgi:metal-responsive CopG/Arc/MetJ family transcriptional regulator